MIRYNLCLTWYWEYDKDFVRLFEIACHARKLTILQVTPETLEKVIRELQSGQVTFDAYLDRTEHAVPYQPVFHWAMEQGVYRINPKEVADWAEDKAILHLELINAGINTPYTIILPSFNEQPAISSVDLQPLGLPFVVKPCYGGGGEGVHREVTELEKVLQVRSEFPQHKYLLQQNIIAQTLDGREAWFRIIFVDGKIYPCWWDTRTHIYAPVSAEDEIRFGLSPLRELTLRIAAICKLEFFSTEIAFATNGQWIAIDYVNDQIDLRLQSQAVDGVPDALVEKIASNLADLIDKKRPRRWFKQLLPPFWP
jgi:hypothetical protein